MIYNDFDVAQITYFPKHVIACVARPISDGISTTTRNGYYSSDVGSPFSGREARSSYDNGNTALSANIVTETVKHMLLHIIADSTTLVRASMKRRQKILLIQKRIKQLALMALIP